MVNQIRLVGVASPCSQFHLSLRSKGVSLQTPLWRFKFKKSYYLTRLIFLDIMVLYSVQNSCLVLLMADGMSRVCPAGDTPPHADLIWKHKLKQSPSNCESNAAESEVCACVKNGSLLGQLGTQWTWLFPGWCSLALWFKRGARACFAKAYNYIIKAKSWFWYK